MRTIESINEARPLFFKQQCKHIMWLQLLKRKERKKKINLKNKKQTNWKLHIYYDY